MSDEPNCGVGRKKLSLQECNKSVQYLKIQNTRKGAILRRKEASNGENINHQSWTLGFFLNILWVQQLAGY
jgi:hypothetical protein